MFGLGGMLADLMSGFEALLMGLAIAAAVVVLIVTLIVGHIPFGERLPGIGPYVRPARLVAFLTFGVLAALVTLHLADGRCDARMAADRAAAEEARQARDRQISDDLEKRYRPTITTLQQRAAALQEQVGKYAKKAPAGAGACKLGADALGLRRNKSK